MKRFPMKTTTPLFLLILAACSQNPKSSSLKASGSSPVECSQGQEKLSFALSASDELRDLIYEVDDMSFDKSGMTEELNKPSAAENEVTLNVCFDSAANEVKSLLSIDVSLYDQPFSLHEIIKAEGLTEAVFGDFEQLHIMAKTPDDPKLLFVMEKSKDLSAAAATWLESSAEGLKYKGWRSHSAEIEPYISIGTFNLSEKTKQDGCISTFALTETKLRFDGVDMKMKACLGGETLTVAYLFMSLEVTDTKANPPLHFVIEGGKRAINNQGDNVLYAKDNETISLASQWMHHNINDTFHLIHPQLEIQIENSNKIRIRRNNGPWSEAQTLSQPHFFVGLEYEPDFIPEIVLSPLVSALDLNSDWLDLYKNGSQEICFNDSENLFRGERGERTLPQLSEASLGSPAFIEALKVATADSSAQFKYFVKDAERRSEFGNYDQISAVYMSGRSTEKRLPIAGCLFGAAQRPWDPSSKLSECLNSEAIKQLVDAEDAAMKIWESYEAWDAHKEELRDMWEAASQLREDADQECSNQFRQ